MLYRTTIRFLLLLILFLVVLKMSLDITDRVFTRPKVIIMEPEEARLPIYKLGGHVWKN